MPLVGPGFRDQIDDTARELAPFRSKIVVLDLKLRYRILRRDHQRQVDVANVEWLAIQIFRTLVGERSSDLIIGEVKRVLANDRAGSISLRNHRWSHGRKVVNIPSIQGQLVGLALLDDLA